MYHLSQALITQNPTFSDPTKITVKGIMLHSIGIPQPKAEGLIHNWDSKSANTSVHAIIEAEGRVYQLLPWHYKAWHCGGVGNNTHIGIELTEPATIAYTTGTSFHDKDPKATKAFVRASYQTAVALVAQLCVDHTLKPLSDGVIVSHAEGHKRKIASNHADVEHLWNHVGLTMAQFRRDVAAEVGRLQNGVGAPAPSLP